MPMFPDVFLFFMPELLFILLFPTFEALYIPSHYIKPVTYAFIAFMDDKCR